MRGGWVDAECGKKTDGRKEKKRRGFADSVDMYE